jgi:hypothetical protein
MRAVAASSSELDGAFGLIYQPVFNSIVGFVLIVLAIYYGAVRV